MLKRDSKKWSFLVKKSITNTEALDLIAKREGYISWSLLQSKKDGMFQKSYDEILDFFNPGDIVLIGARPNPLDLKFFNKIIMLHKSDESSEVVDVIFYRPKEFSFKVGWGQDLKFYSLK